MATAATGWCFHRFFNEESWFHTHSQFQLVSCVCVCVSVCYFPLFFFLKIHQHINLRLVQVTEQSPVFPHGNHIVSFSKWRNTNSIHPLILYHTVFCLLKFERKKKETDFIAKNTLKMNPIKIPSSLWTIYEFCNRSANCLHLEVAR